jgi:hypothetical protein
MSSLKIRQVKTTHVNTLVATRTNGTSNTKPAYTASPAQLGVYKSQAPSATVGSPIRPASAPRKSNTKASTYTQDLTKLEAQRNAGANWFFLLAALSLLNSLFVMWQADGFFLLGLAVTQAIDGFAAGIKIQTGVDTQLAALTADIFIAAIFVSMGILARKGYMWALVAGICLYVADGLLLLLASLIIQVPLSLVELGLRLFVLFVIGRGLLASRRLRALRTNC